MRLLVERGHGVADDLHGVSEIPRVRGGVQDADVRAVPDEPKGVDAALAQRDVEVGAKETGIPTLRDDDIALQRRELG